MRKKILLFLLVIVLTFSLGFSLVACVPSDDNGSLTPGDGGATPTPDPVPDNPNPPVENPVWAGASSYFTGAKVLYTNNSLKNENNENKSFSSLINRQIEGLTFEILHRLGRVYGSEFDKKTYEIKDAEDNKTLSTIRVEETVVSPDRRGDDFAFKHLNTGKYCGPFINRNLDITCPGCYGAALKDGGPANALNGGTGHASFAFRGIIERSVGDEVWKMSTIETDAGKTTAIRMYNTYAQTFKKDIANIFAGTTGLSYETAISRLDHLGYTENEKQKLTNYIFENVIGTTAYNLDNSRRPGFNEVEMNDNRLTTEQRKFKNYDLIVKSIVNTTLTNVTYDSSTNKYTNLLAYPTAPKNLVQNFAITDLASQYKEYQKIVLKPKSSTPITTLKMVLNAQDNVSLEYDFNFKVVANGTTICDKVITPAEGKVTVTNTNKTYTFTIGDKNASKKQFTSYSGSDSEVIASGDVNPWTTNIKITANDNGVGIKQNMDNGNSYVEITFLPKEGNTKLRVNIYEYVNKLV